MNLLKPTNNIENNMMAHSRMPTPEVGMGATQLMYTDRYAGTIVAVKKNAKGKVVSFVFQQDNAKRTDGLGATDSGQQYEYTPNPNAEKIAVSLRKTGQWVKQGDAAHNGTHYAIGVRDGYHDYSF